MTTLQDRIFAAIKADPKPITQDRALEIGLQVIGDDGKHPSEFKDWMDSNGAKLVQMLNELS